MDDFEGQIERFDPLLVETAPSDGAAEIAALRRRFSRREGFRAARVLQRLPVRQARAFLLHILREPPFLLGEHAGLAEVFDLAGGSPGIQRLAARRLPDLHGDVQIAGFQPGELGKVVGLDIFDRVSGLLQYLTH
jgi:hypothetical protein